MSPAYKDRQKPLEQSALKPKKLEFTSSPSRQFSLLDFSDSKLRSEERGRFSLALHACMTPRDENISMIIESDNEGNERDCQDSFINQRCHDDDASQEVLAFDVEVASNGEAA